MDIGCTAEDKRLAAACVVVYRRTREKTLGIDAADGMIDGGVLDDSVGHGNQFSDTALYGTLIVSVGQDFIAWLLACPITDIDTEIIAKAAVNEPLGSIGSKKNIS